MTKRIAMLCTAAGLLLLAMVFLMQLRFETHEVIHQHEVWPAEVEGTTGFDIYGGLTTHLPLILIETKGQEIPGALGKTDEDLYCTYSIMDSPEGLNSSDDVPTLTGHMAISVRGNSSRKFPKKQYAVRLVDENGQPQGKSLLGMPAQTTWVLNGSYIDHSLIRNYMSYNISGEIMGYAPHSRLCEVMLADENYNLEYLGVYTLIEKPKVAEERLNLKRYDPSFRETSFLLQMNAIVDSIKIPHLKPDYIDVLYSTELVYPSEEEITPQSVEYIKREVLSIEKALYDAMYLNDWDTVNELVDLDSFAAYYVINEYFQNYDAGRRSTYLYQDLGGKLHIGPVWDFDSAYNNFVHAEMGLDWMDVKSTFYYTYLINNPEFVKRCTECYTELRNTVLSGEYLSDYIDRCDAYLGSAARRNSEKWYQGSHDLYLDDIEGMKKFVVERGRYMDDYFTRQNQLLD